MYYSQTHATFDNLMTLYNDFLTGILANGPASSWDLQGGQKNNSLVDLCSACVSFFFPPWIPLEDLIGLFQCLFGFQSLGSRFMQLALHAWCVWQLDNKRLQVSALPWAEIVVPRGWASIRWRLLVIRFERRIRSPSWNVEWRLFCWGWATFKTLYFVKPFLFDLLNRFWKRHCFSKLCHFKHLRQHLSNVHIKFCDKGCAGKSGREDRAPLPCLFHTHVWKEQRSQSSETWCVSVCACDNHFIGRRTHITQPIARYTSLIALLVRFCMLLSIDALSIPFPYFVFCCELLPYHCTPPAGH